MKIKLIKITDSEPKQKVVQTNPDKNLFLLFGTSLTGKNEVIKKCFLPEKTKRHY